MNLGDKLLLWMLATLVLSVIAAVIIHPAVLLGTIIGIATTTMRDLS